MAATSTLVKSRSENNLDELMARLTTLRSEPFILQPQQPTYAQLAVMTPNGEVPTVDDQAHQATSMINPAASGAQRQDSIISRLDWVPVRSAQYASFRESKPPPPRIHPPLHPAVPGAARDAVFGTSELFFLILSPSNLPLEDLLSATHVSQLWLAQFASSASFRRLLHCWRHMDKRTARDQLNSLSIREPEPSSGLRVRLEAFFLRYMPSDGTQICLLADPFPGKFLALGALERKVSRYKTGWVHEFVDRKGSVVFELWTDRKGDRWTRVWWPRQESGRSKAIASSG